MLAISIAQQDIQVMEMEFVLKLPQLWFLLLAHKKVLFILKLELLKILLIHQKQ